jgi:hypothetical protein
VRGSARTYKGGMTSHDGNSTSYNSKAHLNEFQATRLRVTCEYIDKVIGEMEEVLHSDMSKAAFSQVSGRPDDRAAASV